MADQEYKCPNCGPGTKTHASDKGHVCETCGGTFTYVAGEAKLAAVGEVDQLKADVKELQQRLPASSPAAEPLFTSAEEQAEEDLGDEQDDEDM